MKILVLGGAGYIGSHTVYRLIEQGNEVVIFDNLETGYIEAVHPKAKFYKGDLRNRVEIDAVLDKEDGIDAVIHFAGLKAVGESCQKPIEYYDNNIGGTLKLCDVMRNNGCKNIVFSSSATVYGMKNVSPLKETMKTGGTTNPYGTTKYMIEIILEDIYKSDNEWNVTLLRYFNPIGAHESGRIGENPSGIPNNLMPYITQVAIGKRPFLSVYGNDYDTPDGTCIRDYIHVVDLADGHVKAVNNILDGKKGVQIFNLGTGKGYSVLDIVKAFSKAYGKELPYKIAPRRPGDLAVCFSGPSKAKEVLGWEAKRGIDDMCRDSWNWQSKNPNGYDD